MIIKRENELKYAYFVDFAYHTGNAFEVLHHQDVRKSGYPDVTVSGYHLTSWWEFKHATPRFVSPRNQEMMCERLAITSALCRYVIFLETPTLIETRIYTPRSLAKCGGKLTGIEPLLSWPGFNFDALREYMVTFHRNNGRLFT